MAGTLDDPVPEPSTTESPLPPAPQRVRRRQLDPMWLGAVALGLFLLSEVIMFSYDLFDFPWQQRWGSWNRLVGLGLAISPVIPLRLWTTSAHKA